MGSHEGTQGVFRAQGMINGMGLESIQHVAPGSMPHVERKLIRAYQFITF